MRLLSLLVAVAAFAVPAAADELTVLSPEMVPSPRTMLRDYLRPHVHAALDRRAVERNRLTTPEAIATWQRALREQFVDSLGGFPERTPLNARVVGETQGDGFRIEKVLYESRPGFIVTANLYLPDAAAPYPAVLFPCGHSDNGKAAGTYQRACQLLARNGMAVLCFDPVGQGERKQLLEQGPDGRHLPHGPHGATTEHMIAGVAPILLGENLATWCIWDGIRGLDYLASRSDIDAGRLGCAGNSGGGMLTSYLVALDERIQAAAPGCFVTTTRRKNERPGPGDAEQNIFAQTAYGLDHPDFLLLAAPRAVLICSATRDYVPIEGAWEAFREAKRLYTRLDASERIDLVEADEPHGFSAPLRAASARFLRRWLVDREAAVTENVDGALFTDAELQCTPDGQVLLLEGARSLLDLYRQRSAELASARGPRWSAATPDERRALVRKVAGIRPVDELPEAAVQHSGAIERDGYTIEKLVLEPEEGIRLPALLFRPAGIPRGATLYVHGKGKHVDAAADGVLPALVRAGQLVLAVDLRGYGETETVPWRYRDAQAGPNGAEYFIAYMLGRSFVGMRGEDILTSARYLQTIAGGAVPLDLVAVDRATVPALHAAATAPALFRSVTLRDGLPRWQLVVEARISIDQLENTIHGVLRRYDLPDLVELTDAAVSWGVARDATGAAVAPEGTAHD